MGMVLKETWLPPTLIHICTPHPSSHPHLHSPPPAPQLSSTSVLSTPSAAEHLEGEAFYGLSVHCQDNVTSCNGPMLFSWLPRKEPLNPHKVALEVAAVSSLHLHETESQTAAILLQFDFKLRTCNMGVHENRPFGGWQLAGLDLWVVMEMNCFCLAEKYFSANFDDGVHHTQDRSELPIDRIWVVNANHKDPFKALK